MNIPVYRGRVRQRGYGLGGTLKTIGSNVIPYLVENMSGTLLNEVSNGVRDVLAAPKTYKHVAKKRGKKVLKHISTKLLKDIRDDKLIEALTGKGNGIKTVIDNTIGQSGSGRRKRCHGKPFRGAKKRRLDFFD